MGVLCLSLRLAGGWVYARRLCRRKVQPTSQEWRSLLSRLARQLGIKQRVQILESSLATIPTVIGWLKPVILLPTAALAGLSPTQLEAILIHELAHIRRLDYLVNLLQTLVEILLFYHPAVWWVSRRIRIERENCCDDVAVTVLGDARGYAIALTRMEELRGEVPTLAVAASGGSLLNRIRRLLSPVPTSRASVSWVGLALAVSMLAIVGMSLHASLPVALPSEPQAKAPRPQREQDPKLEEYMLRLRQTDIGDFETRRRLAEEFIRDNPEHPRLDMAYGQLLQSLSFVDARGAIELADRFLQDPTTDTRFRNRAYETKFRSYQKLGDEDAARELARYVLENEDDYRLLHTAAAYDQERALLYTERALERAEEAGASGQYKDLLHGWYSHYLAKEGRHEKAAEHAVKVIELKEEYLARAESGDGRVIHTPKAIRGGLASAHLFAADRFAHTDRPARGLSHLTKAEELDREATLVAPDGRGRIGSVETIRGRILEALGRAEDALDSYIRSYAAKMDSEVLAKIEELSLQTGTPLLESLRQVDKNRASGPPFKPFELKTLRGETRRLGDYEAKVLVITFVSPRCGPCTSEAPYLEEMYRKYKGQGLEIVALNTDPEQTEKVGTWQTKGGYTFPVLVGATREFLKKNYNYPPRPGGYAAYVVLNQERKVMFRHMMELPARDGVLEAEVRELLGLQEAQKGELIAEIRFDGNTVFTDEELSQALKLVEQGQLYVAEKLEYDVQVNVLDEYRKKGYIFAKSPKPVLTAITDEGAVKGSYRITIPIEEGPQFHYGSFQLLGVKALALEDLLKIYDVTPGEVVNYSGLKTANEQLKRAYCRQGYLDMEPIPEMNPDHELREVSIKIQLAEGRQYVFGNLLSVADSEESLKDSLLGTEELGQSWLLQQGEVFNCDLLDLSILRLKRRFRVVKYDLAKNRETGKVDVTVDLQGPRSDAG